MLVRTLPRPPAAATLAAAAVLLGGGCGGDDEGRVSQEGSGTGTTQSTTTSPTTPETTPAQTETTPETETEASPDAGAGLPDGHGRGQEGPEDRPGGAGDEIPASVPAALTGRDGAVTPRLVRVPPFIAIRVTLRSGDGATYQLRGGGQEIRATRGPGGPVTFDGLRPGRRLVLRGTGGRVVIEASAEPGP